MCKVEICKLFTRFSEKTAEYEPYEFAKVNTVALI